jgi:hypothetical protein
MAAAEQLQSREQFSVKFKEDIDRQAALDDSRPGNKTTL